MQRKSIGQVRRKQGEQELRLKQSMPRVAWQTWSGQFGRGAANGTTTGVPTAAAMCIGPVSLVRNTSQSLIREQSSCKVVLPARFKGPEVPLRLSICGGEFQDWSQSPAPKSTSALPPKINQQHFVRFEVPPLLLQSVLSAALGWPIFRPGVEPNKGWDLLGLSGARPKRFAVLARSTSVTRKKAPSGVGSIPERRPVGENRGFDAPLAKWPWPPLLLRSCYPVSHLTR